MKELEGDMYNIRAYFAGNDSLLAFELKYDEKSENKKIEYSNVLFLLK